MTPNEKDGVLEEPQNPQKKFGAYQIISIIILVIILALSIAASVFFLKEIGWKNLFDAEAGREKIQAYIAEFGVWSKYVYIGIVFVSVILAVIPNNVVAIAGGYLYGTWESIGLTLIGAILGSLAAFGLSRAFGRPLVYQIAKQETMEKIEKKLEGKNSLLFILFMIIPFIPGDAVCYAAGLTKMKFKQFLILVSLTRIPGTSVSSYMGGGNIPWWVWVIFFVALFIVVALAAIYGRKIAAWLRNRNKNWEALAETFEGLNEVFTFKIFSKKSKSKEDIVEEDTKT
ncbi:MAG TPA: TVP38/TMEM64 family protein [Clostridiales bacterium]|nr:TVP38/TMEM64 family protein [Clostridiales bacterium]